MVRKLIVFFICVSFVVGTVMMGLAVLYFAVPSRKAMSEIQLASTVRDPEQTVESTQEPSSSGISGNLYVADVYQSLTLRSAPSSESDPVTEEGLAPLTRLEVQEFTSGTDFAYVRVLDGDHKDLFGYVNSQYITPEGSPTVRAYSASNN